MDYNLIIDDRATFEIRESFDYYVLRSTKIAEKFLTTIQEYLEKTRSNPKQFQVKREEIREAYLKTFPFVIIHQIVKDVIIIYSVFHTSRNPSIK